jgi:uncharacterized protein
MSYHRFHNGYLTLSVKVSANAPKNEIKSSSADAEFLHVKVRGIREKGQANEALLNYFSKITGIAISRMEIVKGQTASLKIVRIDCDNPEDVLRKILEFDE